jgi:hypothetical protein
MTMALMAVVFLGSVAHVQPLLAQVLAPGARPTFSPWFSLYQHNTGPLDNYHILVQPQIQAINTFQQQGAAIQSNASGLAAIGEDVNRLQERGRVHSTGTNSVFMYYSHYYPAFRRNAAATPSGVVGAPRVSQ